MLKDRKAASMFSMLDQGFKKAVVARGLRMSVHTVTKYQEAGKLPSQLPKVARTYRTRKDPLEAYWADVERLLESDSQLRAFTLFEWLKQKHNDPTHQPITDELRRTLERRVRNWKVEHQVEQEVVFPQLHHPGDVIAFDFVSLNELKITIAGVAFEHLLFHAVLTYSNWEHVHVCHSESFEALSTGLQDALHEAGGVPRRVRSDSLTAAVNNLSDDREFNPRYQGLLKHYDLKGHRINVRKPQENGDVESLHGHFKTRLDQALRLRGNRDFADRPEYVRFLQELVVRGNRGRQARFREERAVLQPLPAERLLATQVFSVRVPADCVIRIKRNSYSVNSAYKGLKLEVRLHQDHLELWYANRLLEQVPRLVGRGKAAIDFRHVINSLVRKPGAFVNYKYAEYMYPTTRFRTVYDVLRQQTAEAQAVKQYLQLLKLAKDEGLTRVDEALQACLA